jgi:hypothetical protein
MDSQKPGKSRNILGLRKKVLDDVIACKRLEKGHPVAKTPCSLFALRLITLFTAS